MVKFKKFESILESVKYKTLKLVVLTNIGAESPDTPDFLISKAEKAGMETYKLQLEGSTIKDRKNKFGDFLIKNKDDERGFVINPNNTVIISRRGVLKNTYTRGFQSLLERNGFFCVNSLQSMEICENKYITGEKLQSVGLPTPRTSLVQDSDSIDNSLEKIGGKFPVIVKTLSGAGGVGVSIINSYESLVSTLQTMWKISNVEVLLQEKVETDYDIRIQVLTKKFNHYKNNPDNVIILGYMRRNKVNKDFRTNHSLGGSVEKIEITEEQRELAIKAASTIGCHWCGVDIIVDKKTGKNYIIEVNTSPGTKGLEKAIGKTITGDIINFVSNKDNWSRPPIEIGFREVVEVLDIGEFVAKFDSGNGSKSNSIHADSLKVVDKMLHWELNKRKFKHKIVRISNSEVGDKIETRPVIYLDIRFGGKIFNDVEFSIVNRTQKSTPMLINRKTMERLGVTINPQKAFVLTNGDNFSAADGKGKPYHGISFNK